MSEATILERQHAIARYDAGESATAICVSLGRSREWLYKWVKRHQNSGEGWADGPLASSAPIAAAGDRTSKRRF